MTGRLVRRREITQEVTHARGGLGLRAIQTRSYLLWSPPLVGMTVAESEGEVGASRRTPRFASRRPEDGGWRRGAPRRSRDRHRVSSRAPRREKGATHSAKYEPANGLGWPAPVAPLIPPPRLSAVCAGEIMPRFAPCAGATRRKPDATPQKLPRRSRTTAGPWTGRCFLDKAMCNEVRRRSTGAREPISPVQGSSRSCFGLRIFGDLAGLAG
jgi:hypothetical protein